VFVAQARRHHRDCFGPTRRQPEVIMVRWSTALTITTSARYNGVASAAMQLLAEASTTLARIKASRRLQRASILLLTFRR
jgi:hypothetical protein